MKRKTNRRDFVRKSVMGASFIGISSLSGLSGSGHVQSSKKQRKIRQFDPIDLAPGPPLGWNSYNSFLGSGTKFDSANEWRLMENLEVFSRKLKPSGYEYFVVDCRWFAPTADGSLNRLDEYGRSLPSEFKFPNGFKPIIDRAHELGIKFGLHLVRGIPKKAVELNLPVKETNYRAKDVMSEEIQHRWKDLMVSVDLDKPGAQEYYNSVLDLLAEWEVDFLKYDEIERFPRDIEAVANAIAQCGRKIVFSISPGDWADTKLIDLYKRTCSMLRITGDVWDRQESLEKCFRRWEEFQNYGGDGLWLDLDMIPFGHLLLPYPNVAGVKAPYMGYERMDSFTPDQKQTFMTQRAMSASPLFMGGHLPTTDDYSFEMITNTGMLECNQNGVTGKLAERKGKVEMWKTPSKTKSGEGWLGIFNRGEEKVEVALDELASGLDNSLKYNLSNIWEKKPFEGGLNTKFSVNPNGVMFIKYSPE